MPPSVFPKQERDLRFLLLLKENDCMWRNLRNGRHHYDRYQAKWVPITDLISQRAIKSDPLCFCLMAGEDFTTMTDI